LGLAVLGGAGLARLPRSVALGLVLVSFVDVLFVNQLQLPLAYARQSFDALYGGPLRALQAQLDGVERLYGEPLTAVGYRNHALQSRVETTYGYNPLELAAYADYIETAETNPRLVVGLAATDRLAPDGRVSPNLAALPLAAFARATTTDTELADLDPNLETRVTNPLAVTPDASATVTVLERGADYLILRYRSATPTNLLRVAIPAYPGWRAELGPAELPLVTLDRAFTGIVVPAGEGDIRLHYVPRYFVLGATISALALLACVAAFRWPRPAQ
jgi:hypothetical protein